MRRYPLSNRSLPKSPIRITFDTNTYSPITRPQLRKAITTGWPLTPDRWLSKKKRVAWWYINWCIRRGRIVAGIPEAAFAAEVMPNVDRVAFIAAVGTPKVTTLITITDGRRALIQEAFRVGFRALHGARITYGQLVGVRADQWAPNGRFSLGDIQDRQSKFVRHFDDYPLDAVRAFGEKMAAAHGLGAKNTNPYVAQAAAMHKVSIDRFLWREGLLAESKSPLTHASQEDFQGVVRHLLADWADFDIASVHYAYGYDFLCTEDKGKPRSDSIFGAQYAHDLANVFGLKVISLTDLAALCWTRFHFPIRTWHNSG